LKILPDAAYKAAGFTEEGAMQEPRVGETALSEHTTNEGFSGDRPDGRGREGMGAAPSLNRRGQEAVEEAKEALRGAGERVSAAYDRTAGQANRAYLRAREYAQDNPGTATLVAFAAGLGVGAMVASRSALRGYRRGLVPMTAAALAEAVLSVFGNRR
jgi:ElaB/YqjD/DUF883 family membrane-anchored ribosome-binding protein